jgi:hypothetical protein
MRNGCIGNSVREIFCRLFGPKKNFSLLLLHRSDNNHYGPFISEVFYRKFKDLNKASSFRGDDNLNTLNEILKLKLNKVSTVVFQKEGETRSSQKACDNDSTGS